MFREIVMRTGRCACVVTMCCGGIAATASAQQPVAPPAPSSPSDTGRVSGDSLTRRPLMMHAVTITTTQPRRDEPLSAVRVSQDAIQNTPAINTWDLIRQTANVEVHEQGQGPGFASDAAIRGFSSDHSTDLALWIDGVPINEPVNGHAEGYNDWSLLFPQAVQSIEVLKGPVSALYGNFSMSGTVNVRTLERMQGTQASLSGGAYGHMDASLLSGVDKGATGAVFGIHGTHEDGWRPNSGYDLGQGHARWVHDLSPGTTIDAGLELYATRWHSPGFINDSLFDARQYQIVENRTDGGFKRHAQERISLRKVVGSNALWRTTVYSTQGRWQLFLTIPPAGSIGEGSGSQTEEEDLRHGFGATSALTWVLPRGEITTGAEGRWDDASYQRYFTTNRTRDSSDLLVSARQGSAAAFVQSFIDLTRHVRASLGVRYDVLDTRSTIPGTAAVSASHGTVSPKFGLLVHLPVSAAVYANVSRGFRQTDGVIADPTLPFITEWSYETGLKLDRGSVSLTASLFLVNTSNEQTFDPVTLQSTSGGASRRKGLEVDGRLRLSSSLSADVDWTFLDARYLHLQVDSATVLDGARIFNTSRYTGIAGLTLAPPGVKWSVRVSTNAAGRYTPFDEPGVELPGYALLHASAALALGRVGTLDVGVRNVLDQAYRELRAGGLVSPGQPRSVFASLRARL